MWSQEEAGCVLGSETLESQGYFQKRQSSTPGPYAVPRCPEERGPHQFLHTFKTPPSSPAPDLPRAFCRGPGHLSFSRSRKQLALRPRCGEAGYRPEGSAVRTRTPEPVPRRPVPLPSRASRASRPDLGALRLPPSRRRRRSAAGRPERVAGSHEPPTACSARSEAIARRAGEEERRR